MKRALLLVAACGSRYPEPITAAYVAHEASGPVLVAYLGQRDASPTVCDPQAKGPHIPAITAGVRGALFDGLVDGKIDPRLWRGCLEAALAGMPPADTHVVFEDALRAYRKLLDGDLASDPPRVARVDAIQHLYVERKAGLDGDPIVTAKLFGELRDARAKLSPVARAFASDLLATVDVEHGTWQGKAVDVDMMDALAEAGNEMTLERFAQRLPQMEMRREAARRIVRVHVALSPFDEVRANAKAVEDRVIEHGNNHVPAKSITRAWFDDKRLGTRSVVIKQNVWDHTAVVLAAGQQQLTVLPELSLRGAVFAEVRSSSRAITICAPAKALDPSPCIDVADVTVDNPLAYLDDGGAFRFRDNVTEAEVISLAAADDFALPIRIGGHTLTAHWSMTYARPDDLAFSGGSTGGRGPDLEVRIDHPSRERYVFTVGGTRGGFASVVQRADLPSYRVASSGVSGASGSTGSTGSTGTSGSECQSGGPGGDGGRGGDGSPGGNGGNIHVVIACGGFPCDSELLAQAVVSIGGAGGSGGSGGAGGSGGSGGPSRSARTHTDANGATVTDDPGCSSGSSGSSGSQGPSGSAGANGHPGRVTVDYGR